MWYNHSSVRSRGKTLPFTVTEVQDEVLLWIVVIGTVWYRATLLGPDLSSCNILDKGNQVTRTSFGAGKTVGLEKYRKKSIEYVYLKQDFHTGRSRSLSSGRVQIFL